MIEFLDKDVISESDLNEMISNHVEESINLDFKDGAALMFSDKTKSEIAKDVSAFANSAGGYIIYGLSEKNHRADSLSPFDGGVYTKEWFEQIIQTRIQRKIDGLIISPVRIHNDVRQSVYIVKIPESSAAPHMTSDKRFYKRYNFESVQMEEYEIRACYNRKDKTSLIVHSVVTRLDKYLPDDRNLIKKEFNIQIKNVGQILERDYKVIVEINGLKNFSYTSDRQFNITHSQGDNDETFFSIMGNSIIFPEEILTIGSFSLGIPKEQKEYLLERGSMKLILKFSTGQSNFDITEFPNLLIDDIN